eukprot:Hpha_TRINITY_DN28642_c0_g1::TRINITY_DN28642_c0_g1_i1::g.156406::m.156406
MHHTRWALGPLFRTRYLQGEHRGTVRKWLSEKGFGFISVDSTGEELFIHNSFIKMDGFRSLATDQEVEFDIREGKDGRKQAHNVTAVGGGEPEKYPQDRNASGSAGDWGGGKGGGKGFDDEYASGRGGGRGGGGSRDWDDDLGGDFG